MLIGLSGAGAGAGAGESVVDDIGGDAPRFQCCRCVAVTFTEEAEQEVFAAEVLVVVCPGRFGGQVDGVSCWIGKSFEHGSGDSAPYA